MSTISPTERDDPGEPLSGDVSELIETFRSAEKPVVQFRVGTEHEKFGFLRMPGAVSQPALPFDGPQGIEAIFQAILDDPDEKSAAEPWVPARDRGRIIALFRSTGSITLEPGGQLELSGAPLRTIHETCEETGAHLRLLRKVCSPRGIGFIGIGFHPTATWAEMPMVPKARYEIMTRYMPRVGSRGLDMMKRTATVQANYDWSDEADFVASYQAALVVAPLVAALFANSPFYEGKVTGAVSERQRVWADTDTARAGFPDPILADDFSYARYVDWVLDVPMYFVRRDGLHHDVSGASFRTFMTSGLDVDGERVRATARDWADHLTTLFPEVRAKRVIEVRSADCGPWSRISALPALYKGILYDAEARAGALALMARPTGRELSILRADVAERGYRAEYRGAPILERCRALVALAREGLKRQGCLNAKGEDEGRFLATLEESVASGKTFAERLVDLYRGQWGSSLAPLWDAIEFWHATSTDM